MSVYWSVEHCRWMPCGGPAEPPATTWTPVGEPSVVPVAEVPEQRADEQVPADR